jgi:hypothetical protein
VNYYYYKEEEVEIIFQPIVEEQTPQALELGHVKEDVGVSICLSVQFLVWYWVYFCIQKYHLKTDLLVIFKNCTITIYTFTNKFDRALVYFLVDTFKFSFISFLNKMWYFPMWTIPIGQNTIIIIIIVIG